MRSIALDATAVVVAYALSCTLARLAGFDHVSDDDFSRVTIAQKFAHSPKLDPSGTSWLPFPFWVLGTVMLIFGRSLFIAHAASIAIASLAAAAPYLALRFAGVVRGRALLATAFALATPWSIWLGAAPVPESFTATLSAAAVVGLSAWRSGGAPSTSKYGAAPLCFALAIAAAALSRYEPWPIAAVLAAALIVAWARDGSSKRPLLLVAACLCVAAPILWMGWNALVHDGPFHFFHRVSSFKREIGAGTVDVVDALLLYPRLLLTSRPEVAIPALFLLPSLRDPDVRRRWGLPILCAVAQLLFLSYGNARDGAPTHHPERALLGTMILVALFVADVGVAKLIALVREGRPVAAKVAAASFAVAWVVSTVRGYEPPGRSPSEERSEQIARGHQLRESGARSIAITPCAYEHYALLAAFAAPERAEIRPRSAPPPGGSCPSVELRASDGTAP